MANRKALEVLEEYGDNPDDFDKGKVVESIVQASLNGVWRELYGGCPHLHRARDVDRCDINELRPCVYETGDGPCEILQTIIDEWNDPAQASRRQE